MRQDRSKYHYKLGGGEPSPALGCLWAVPEDDGRPAGARSNSADKGTCSDGAGGRVSGQQISQLSYGCHLLSCQNRIM